jgi:hypothetical protein
MIIIEAHKAHAEHKIVPSMHDYGQSEINYDFLSRLNGRGLLAGARMDLVLENNRLRWSGVFVDVEAVAAPTSFSDQVSHCMVLGLHTLVGSHALPWDHDPRLFPR